MPSPVPPVNPPTYLIVNSQGVGALTVAPQQAAGPLMQVVITDSGAGYPIIIGPPPSGVTNNVALTGGSGSGAIASIVVTGNVVTGVTITNNGNGLYVVGDVLSVPSSPPPTTAATVIVTYLPSGGSSTLELSGVNALNWGSNIWESLYRLTESFAAPTAPGTNLVLGGAAVSPLYGQLWFDTSNQSLNVYTTSGWVTLETSGVSSVIGTSPIIVVTGGGAPLVNLASAVTYAALASSTITNVGFSVLTGDLGLYPAGSITGFPPGTVSGTIHNGDTAAHTALTDASNAFIAGNALPGATVLSASTYDFAGGTITPGLYSIGTGATITTGVTLNAGGNPNATFIFQIGSTLTVPTSSVVTLAGGAQAKNVYWLVGSSASFAGTATFNGTIIAQASISMASGGTVTGHLFALTGAVTFAGSGETVTATPAGAGAGGVANISLAPSGVTPGTYTLATVTVDAQGLVTFAANGSAGGTGTVTSVGATGSTGLVIGGTNPITGSGTLTFTLAGNLQGLSSLSTLGFVQRTAANTFTAAALVSTDITSALGYTPYSNLNPAAFISGNQTITLTGAVTGSGTTSIPTTLANSGVAAGTYGDATHVGVFNVNAKGLITTASSVAISNPALTIPTFTGTEAVFPSGFQMRFGQLVQAAGNVSHVFSPTFPTACLSLVVSIIGSTGVEFEAIISYNASGFVYYANNNCGITYIAVGY